jgi:hypothetical protein
VRPLVLFCLLGFLLSGCLKLDATLTVGPDNTITGEYVVAYKKDPNRPDTGLGTVRELLVSKGTATASRYDDGDYDGTRYRLEGVPLEDLARFVPVTYDRRQTGSIQITRDGEDFLVAGTFDFREAKPTRRTVEQQRQAEDLFKVRVRLTFPGTVESGNGTIEGNTITWQMNPFVLTTLQARASAIPPPAAAAPASPVNAAMLLALGGGGLALIILLGLGLWALRRRGRERSAPPAMAVESADPADFAWVVGDRRQPPQQPAHESWAGAPADLRYGPGLGGPSAEHRYTSGLDAPGAGVPGPGMPGSGAQGGGGPGMGAPGLGTPIGQVSWYGQPLGPSSEPPARADVPAVNGYGPPAQFRPQQGPSAPAGPSGPPGPAGPPGPPSSWGPSWYPAETPPDPPPGSGPS